MGSSGPLIILVLVFDSVSHQQPRRHFQIGWKQTGQNRTAGMIITALAFWI